MCPFPVQAANEGDIQRLSLLIENGVPVDVPDYDGRTALHRAATEGQLLSTYQLVYRHVFSTLEGFR